MSFGALHVARTALDAQSFRMQVIANNLANVNTTGFKRDRASFETLSYQMMTAPGAPSTAENRYATGLNLGRAPDGSIVTSDCKPLQPQIQIPEDATNVSIGTDGTVSATGADGTLTELGRIEIALFANPAGLQAIGDNLLVETQASGAPQVGGAGEEGRGSLRGGMLEGSNVNVVEELVDMIETQRAYEVNSKMISATDDMLKYVNQNI